MLAQTADPLTGLPSWVTAGGAVTILGWMVWLLIHRKLIPLGTYEDLVSDRDGWRQAFADEHQARLHADAAAKMAVEGVALANKILADLHAEQARRRAIEEASR